MEGMKHFDTFTGYGGFTISAQKLGWETVGFSEVDKYANAVLKYNFKGIKNYGDITKIKGEDLPAIDIITGGSPCQDLSVAGKGAGLNGARSGLFFHFIRLIKEIQPQYFIWENVKGALSSSRGWDFARVQIEMEQAGYDVWWQTINAKDFGVPQNRERIFIIGIRKGSRGEILFEQRESSKNLAFIGGTKHRKEWLGDGKEKSRNFSQGDRVYSPEGISTNLSANGGGLGAKTGLYAIDMSTLETQVTDSVRALQARYNKGYSHRKAEVSGVLEVRAVLTPDRLEKRQNGRRFKENGEPSFTLNTQDKHGVYNGTRIRRLTPTECERLMGLEDGWTAKGLVDGKEVDISDTQRYKMCGNGVVVNCVDYIYKLLKDNK